MRFRLGRTSADALPPAKLPEIAFVGRSNVGKSSLINALTGRKPGAGLPDARARTRADQFLQPGRAG